MVYRAASLETTDDPLDAVFTALAHPARRELLRHLAGSEPKAMRNLADVAGLSPQLLSKHVAVLERAGLVTRARHGREKRAYPHSGPLSAASLWIDETTSYWNAQLDSLEQYVASLQQPEPEPKAE